jgi:hypothetical protein
MRSAFGKCHYQMTPTVWNLFWTQTRDLWRTRGARVRLASLACASTQPRWCLLSTQRGQVVVQTTPRSDTNRLKNCRNCILRVKRCSKWYRERKLREGTFSWTVIPSTIWPCSWRSTSCRTHPYSSQSQQTFHLLR